MTKVMLKCRHTNRYFVKHVSDPVNQKHIIETTIRPERSRDFGKDSILAADFGRFLNDRDIFPKHLHEFHIVEEHPGYALSPARERLAVLADA